MKTASASNDRIIINLMNKMIVISFKYGIVYVHEVIGSAIEIMEFHRAYNRNAAFNIMNSLKEKYMGA